MTCIQIRSSSSHAAERHVRLAGALEHLAFFRQDRNALPRDSNNEKGYFEHRKATMLNLRCLNEFQMHPTRSTGCRQTGRSIRRQNRLEPS